MELNEIVQLIMNNGFAIVMCLMMFNQNEKQDIRHREETDELRKVIEENTNAIVRLSNHLGGDNDA